MKRWRLVVEHRRPRDGSPEWDIAQVWVDAFNNYTTWTRAGARRRLVQLMEAMRDCDYNMPHSLQVWPRLDLRIERVKP